MTLREKPGWGYDEFIWRLRNARMTALAESLKEHKYSEDSRPEYREGLVIGYLNAQLNDEAYKTMFIASIEKEAQRRSIAVPEKNYLMSLANSVLFDIWGVQMETFIAHLRSENDMSRSAISEISRACLSCPSTTSINRHAFTVCGHVICRECATKKNEDEPACDHCNKKSKLVKLYEDMIDS